MCTVRDLFVEAGRGKRYLGNYEPVRSFKTKLENKIYWTILLDDVINFFGKNEKRSDFGDCLSNIPK